ncbi:hypothetical protein F5Y01DRAFT_327985 [Xylaria sp. FL0043]|nr:hypothetical protein F5Y01DRAFT_327985 [Xylaria sp. FL0043]
MSYTCDRCQHELFEPASWNDHISLEQHVEAQQREIEGPDSFVGLGYSYEVTLGDLQISWGIGCSFCELLLARVNRLAEGWQATDLLDVRVAPRMPCRVFPPRADALDISISRKERLEGFVWFAIGVFVRPGIGENFFVHGPTETEENFDASIAKAWLQECLRSHAQCKVARSGVMPSRTLRSVDELFRGISFGSLPAALKDAVQVTHDLHIQYIWIDALRIFQDSSGDLAKEIASMEVYIQQAVLVLQPSLVSSVQDPFLHDRAARQRKDIEPRRNITLQVESTNGQPYSVVLDLNTPWYQPDKEPVNSRAWIMQECLLCPRVLILPSVGGMVWQCETYESIHGRIHYAHAVEEDRGRIAATWRPWDLSPQPPLTAKEVHNAWLTQVDDYNKRDLTNPHDKLLATSALAKRFRDNYRDILGKYCAGSWYNFLNVSLHWHTGWEGRSAPDVRPATRGIPSWSWANVNNSMYLSKGQPIMHPHLRIDIVSCEIDLVSPSFLWGSVTGGKLVLRGLTIQVSWDNEDSLFEQYQDTHSTQENEFDFTQDGIRGESNIALLVPVTETGGCLVAKECHA